MAPFIIVDESGGAGGDPFELHAQPGGPLPGPVLDFPSGTAPMALSGAVFPEAAWDAANFAQAILAEFASGGWVGRLSVPDLTNQKSLGDEIAWWRDNATLRTLRAPEILAQ